MLTASLLLTSIFYFFQFLVAVPQQTLKWGPSVSQWALGSMTAHHVTMGLCFHEAPQCHNDLFGSAVSQLDSWLHETTKHHDGFLFP